MDSVYPPGRTALVALGRSHCQIAAELVISTQTVSVHVSNVLAKMSAASRGEAAVVARRLSASDAPHLPTDQSITPFGWHRRCPAKAPRTAPAWSPPPEPEPALTGIGSIILSPMLGQGTTGRGDRTRFRSGSRECGG